jgi:hypothetical protein
MRKITYFLVAIITMTIVSCGSGSATTEQTDSTTAVAVDTGAVSGNDTTVAKIPTDSTTVK